MAVQSEVNFYNAAAVAGDRASQGYFHFTPYNYTAETDVNTGCFVWNSMEDDAYVEGLVKVYGDDSTTDTPLGLAVRIIDHFDYNLLSEGTQVIPANSTVTVAVEGDYWVETTTDATIGQKVFALTADGGIATGDAGGTVDDAVETANWYVKTAGSAGDLIIISTFGK